MPNTGSQIDNAIAASEQTSAIVFSQLLTFNSGSPTIVIETPLFLDEDPAHLEAVAGTSLATRQEKPLKDEQTFAYLLRRILGTLYLGVTADQAGAGSAPAAVMVNAGIILRKTDAKNGLSLATSDPANAVGNVDVANLENNEDPWLWRKDWVLTPINNLLAAGTSTLLPVPDPGDTFSFHANALPRTNMFFTGAHSTPTIDVKSRRRVAQEERMFLDVSFTDLAPIPQSGHSVEAWMVCNYRAYASIFTMSGNRRNSAR